jgi:sugar phosphate isomerase/epimerase
MMPGFPNLSDEFYANYAGWLGQYGTISVAHDQFLDTKRHKDRLLTHDEMVESVKRDIDHAAKLRASVIRMIVITPPEVVEAAAPYAREKGIRLGVEIHSPWHFEHDWIKAHLAVADRVGTDVVGCIPDLGIFVRRFPRVVSDRFLREGADPEIAREIVATYEQGGDMNALIEDLKRRGADEATVALAEACTHYINLDPATLTKYAAYIIHVHAKFYEMTDEGVEYSIPYDEIIAALKAGGYHGYLSSEYEGNRHIQDIQQVDAMGQLTLHQQMMARFIDAEN